MGKMIQTLHWTITYIIFSEHHNEHDYSPISQISKQPVQDHSVSMCQTDIQTYIILLFKSTYFCKHVKTK